MSYQPPPQGGQQPVPPPHGQQQYPPPTHPQQYQQPPPYQYQPAQPVPPSQPVVVKQQKSGGLFSSLGNLIDQAGSELNKAADSASTELNKAAKDLSHITISDRLRPGCVIQLQSKLCGKNIRVLENGAADCGGTGGTACHFRVLAGLTAGRLRFQNMAMPQFHLAISGGYFVGWSRGGPESEFIATITADSKYAILESASEIGSHLGVIPSGQVTSPAQTNKSTDATHFKVLFVSAS